MLKQNFKKKFKTFLITTVIVSMFTGCATNSDMNDTLIHQYNGSVVEVDENINKLVDEDNTNEIDVENDNTKIEDNNIDTENEVESTEKIENDIENIENDISSTNTSSVSDDLITEKNETTKRNEDIETVLENDVDNDTLCSIEDDISNDENIEEEEGKEENNINELELSLNYCERTKGDINIIDDRIITWDASNDSYEVGPEKEIILQINYNKRDSDTTYAANELIIKVPNLFYKCEDSQLKAEVSLTANTSLQNGYDWVSIDANKNLHHPSNDDEYFYFTNPKEIGTSITGSLQIVYVLTSLGDNEAKNYNDDIKFYPEEYEDFCTKTFSSTIYATLNDTLETEELKFNYSRTYIHSWERQIFTINTTIEGTDIPNGIVENKNDYIGIRYTYYIPEHDYGYVQDKKVYDSTYPYYANITARIVTDFPDDCIVLNYLYEREDNHYEADYAFTYKGAYRNLGIKPIIVLYPKSEFNQIKDTYLTINDVELYVEHESLGFVYNNHKCIEFNLGTFDIEWPSDEGGGLWCDLYNYAKLRDTDINPDGRKYYSDIFRIRPNRAIREYPREYQMQYQFAFADQIKNKTTDVYLGIDKIFITGKDNEYRLLNDDEYFISCIEFPNMIHDAYGTVIPTNTYEIELYLRYAGSTEYTLYDTFMNPMSQSKSYLYNWDYLSRNNEKQVVGYYFKIKDVKNGITKSDSDDGTPLQTFFFYVMSENIADYGNIYPFCYIDAVDNNGKSYLNQTEDDYVEFAKTILAPMDLAEKGYYLGRGTDKTEFNPLSKIVFANKLGTKIETEKSYDDKELKKYFGTSIIHLNKGDNIKDQYANYFSYLPMIPNTQKIKGFECWNLLPYGMELESSADEIKNSIKYFNTSDLEWHFTTYYNDSSVTSIANQLKNVCNLEIIENYNNTKRTMLHLKFDLGDNTAVFSSWNPASIDYLNFTYDFSISYDAYMENSSYTNNVYANWVTNQFLLQNSVKDNGNTDKDALDINGDGNTNDELAFATSSITLSDMVSSQQGIFKEVKSDMTSEFQTGVIESSLDSDYLYKITVRTGSTPVTDLVIYDNIEEAYKDNTYWKGEFVDVDTSYAESDGYTIKVYYSEKTDASTLDNDDSWKEYTNSVDKSTVKSLAFQYLDKNGNSAIFPVNAMTYVIIKMHSPIEMDFNKTYNFSRVEWNAIDKYGNVIPKIIGLNSNTVSVALPYSDVMLPFTGGNGDSWLYIIVAFTTTIGLTLLYIAKKYKK